MSNVMDGKLVNISARKVSASIMKTAAKASVKKAFDGATPNEKYMWLNNSTLQTRPEIQRKLKTSRVDKIKSDYSPCIATPVQVSYRDGKFFVLDGNHIREVMAEINGGEDFPIFCRVHFGLTAEDEAYVVAAQGGYVEAMSMMDRLRAMEAAKDPEVLDFLTATRASGLTISLDKSLSIHGNIAAVCTAYSAYKKLGNKDYTRMLNLLFKTWAGENWSISKNMIGGMASFLNMYDVKIPVFVRAFREVTYEEILDEVGRFKGMTKVGAYAAALAEIYSIRVEGETLKEIGA